MKISSDVNKSSVQDLNSLKRLERGGHYRPRECEPRERTAIIIPYRDRATHLEVGYGVVVYPDNTLTNIHVKHFLPSNKT